MIAQRSNEDLGNQVAEYWARVAKTCEMGYWNTPGWTMHQNQLATGDPKKDWLGCLAADLRRNCKIQSTLSIGCGRGYLEPLLLSHQLGETIDACDLSPYLIEKANERAKRESLPINYFVADLNSPNFEAQKYDLIAGFGIFHHIQELEKLFEAMLKALKPGGRLLMYDYVGPTRFQWTTQQIKICNECLDKLPQRYKIKRGYPWHHTFAKQLFDSIPGSHSSWAETFARRVLPKPLSAQFPRIKSARLCLDTVESPPPEQFLVTDPSEAIRSEEILPLLKQHFVIEIQLPMGGTLVQPIFGRIASSFCQNKEGARLASIILDRERSEIISGSLQSDLVAVIARPRRD